MKAKKMEE